MLKIDCYDDNDTLKLGYANLDITLDWDASDRDEEPIVWLVSVDTFSSDDQKEKVDYNTLPHDTQIKIGAWVIEQIEKGVFTNRVIDTILNW